MFTRSYIEVLLTMTVLMSSVGSVDVSRGASRRPTERMDYCQWEAFTAECRLPGEVLLVREALYGRMHLGRCVKRDFGFLDCGTDVLEKVSRHCSARRYCTFPVTSLHGNHGCPMDLTAYLSIRYECVKVTDCSPSVCDRSETLSIPTDAGGYLLSVPPASLSSDPSAGTPGEGIQGPCGTVSCPWRLAVKPGQRIRLVVSDFSAPQQQSSVSDGSPGVWYGEGTPTRGSGAAPGAGMGPCHRYASVQEPTEGSSVKHLTFCERDPAGITNSTHYTSRADSLSLIVYTISSPASHFIIRYTAIGCPNLDTPPGAKSRRDGESLVIECRADSSQVWRLQCVSNAWIGQVGSCIIGSSSGQYSGSADDQQAENLSGTGEQSKSSSYGVLIVVGLGIVIGVIVGFTMLLGVLVCVRRRRHRQGATTVIKETGADGAPCYWKSLKGMPLQDDAFLPSVETTEHHTVTRIDYSCPEGSCCDRNPPVGYYPTEPEIDIHQRHDLLLPCCRGAMPPTSGGFQYATYTDSNLKRRDHVYELPGKTLDPETKQTAVRVAANSDQRSNVIV